ncbi:MAG: purE [Thermoleophilia bacterium]|nr:purE [Thermoleophilia bacterium]
MAGASPFSVLILCGSDSDAATMTAAARTLADFGIEWDLRVSSAHRAPDRTIELARTAADRGYGAIIAGAGLAAHLPGVVASVTILPVIGVPLSAGPMRGTDALHAIVQMPRGIPVATVGIDNAANAALLAVRIFALADADVRARLEAYVEALPAGVEAADARVQEQLAADPPGSPTPTTTTGG